MAGILDDRAADRDEHQGGEHEEDARTSGGGSRLRRTVIGVADMFLISAGQTKPKGDETHEREQGGGDSQVHASR